MISKSEVLRYVDVDISRGTDTVLSKLNIRVLDSEFVYLIGQVGVGKSTLLKTIYADAPITGQEATVVGRDLLRIKSRDVACLRRDLGIIFQKPELLMAKTVYENLDIVLRALGISKQSQRKERIHTVLSWVGLELKSYKYPHELSGGEQQRISIARALLGNPKLILADEPAVHLSLEMALSITELLQRLSREQRVAVIMATHNHLLLERYPATVIDLDVTHKNNYNL